MIRQKLTVAVSTIAFLFIFSGAHANAATPNDVYNVWHNIQAALGGHADEAKHKGKTPSNVLEKVHEFIGVLNGKLDAAGKSAVTAPAVSGPVNPAIVLAASEIAAQGVAALTGQNVATSGNANGKTPSHVYAAVEAALHMLEGK